MRRFRDLARKELQWRRRSLNLSFRLAFGCKKRSSVQVFWSLILAEEFLHPSAFSFPWYIHRAPRFHSIVTTAPSPFRVSIIFSDSSLGTPSFICLGALSTNFLLSTKLKPSKPLISLIILGFAAASNDLSVRVKSVFSCATGPACSSSTGAGGTGAAAKAPPMGISGILSRDCRQRDY